ncbi:MAG TPA: 2-dehydropantoate 2-reductase [Alphaproteobacteria bacterium]|nr:2-dehydropantoate 2-reductase [Alphaproteobacteria bacterium]
MRVCIFGAGAVGSFIAVKLANAGLAVSCVARGPHLAAIRANGLKLESEGKTTVVRLNASDDAAALGPQDFVLLTLKAHQLPAAADGIAALLGPATTLVSCMNGVPWWYFHKLAGPYEDVRLSSVDPGGVLWEKLPPGRALGALVYPACMMVAPGVVRHIFSNRFAVGEPDGADSGRAHALAEGFTRAGLECPVRPRIRDDIWLKLWGNLSFNPISVLTGATLDQMARDAGTQGVARAMMVEAREVAERLGVRFSIDVDRRIAMAAQVGAHKTSMLQDLERGKSLELDALLGAVVEMGRLVGEPTPMCEAILALARERARVAGCYPAEGS